jgi:hypothetical protein
MMEQCSKCPFYDERYDNLEGSHNDLGSDDDHFCVMFNEAIDQKIVNDEVKCEYFTE